MPFIDDEYDDDCGSVETDESYEYDNCNGDSDDDEEDDD